MTDEQNTIANALLKDMNYKLEQLFWGSEYVLEWSASERIAEARRVLKEAMKTLPGIIT